MIGCGPGNGSRLVSTNNSGTVGDGASRLPAINAGGRYVAFISRAHNLDAVVPGASVFRREIGFGDGTLAVSIGDGDPNQASQAAADAEGISISADGDVIAFDTAVPLDAAADRNNVRDVYVRRVISGRTALVSRAGGRRRGRQRQLPRPARRRRRRRDRVRARPRRRSPAPTPDPTSTSTAAT